MAIYCSSASAMRSVVATTVVWVLARFAFWIGYHRSAAMRGLGVPGMALSAITLVYVVARIADEIAGDVGVVIVVAAFLGFEALLFLTTRRQLQGSEVPPPPGD
jgi:hypothetical protein